MGVVVLEDFPNDTGALVKRTIMEQTFTQHGVEDASLHGLQAVTCVGQGPADDDGHRIIDVGRLHDIGNRGDFRARVRGVV